MGYYPEILDFKSKDSYQIDFYKHNPEKVNGITFNEEKEDLKCENLINIKRCTVQKDHFKGKGNDYYYIKYNGYNNIKAIAYETIPVQVMLSNNSKNNKVAIIFGIIGAIILVTITFAVIYFIFFKKKKAELEEKILKTSFNEDEQFNINK